MPFSLNAISFVNCADVPASGFKREDQMEYTAVSPEAALNLMERALQILDSCDAPADIGAHLDLAIERLYAFLGTQRAQPD